MHLTIPLRKSIKGVTMIEVLVALLVLSFGMFGMMGILINSLKLSSSSNYRTVAAQQAYTMAEALRTNPSTLASFAAPNATVTAGCMESGGCTTAQLVNTQFGLWQQVLATALPSGSGTICHDSAAITHNPIAGTPTNWNCDGSGPFVIKVCWDESRIPTSNSIQCTWTNI